MYKHTCCGHTLSYIPVYNTTDTASHGTLLVSEVMYTTTDTATHGTLLVSEVMYDTSVNFGHVAGHS